VVLNAIPTKILFWYNTEVAPSLENVASDVVSYEGRVILLIIPVPMILGFRTGPFLEERVTL